MLAAGCGAPLCVAAVKERDGSVVEDLPAGLQLEVCGEQARTRAMTCTLPQGWCASWTSAQQLEGSPLATGGT